ncbi:MAG: ribonuclease H [Polyangiaceae bacterium]
MPWVQANLRGNKVYARVDAGGAFVVEGGRVEIRYKPNDGRKYGARADNLSVVSGEILPDETCGPANGVDASKGAAAKAAGAGSGEGASSTDGAGAEGAAKPKAAPRAKRGAKAADGGAGAKAAADGASAQAEAASEVGSGAIHVYADGACSGNPGPAGIGVVVLDGESRVEISEYIGKGTNNIAELTAILRALMETAESERTLVIHTDSSYSIGVLQKGWKAKANQELIAELKQAMKTAKPIKLVYVPGHAGVRWNERADSLARAAVMSRSSVRHVVRAAGPAAGASAAAGG